MLLKQTPCAILDTRSHKKLHRAMYVENHLNSADKLHTHHNNLHTYVQRIIYSKAQIVMKIFRSAQ